jgi:tetratricopeptide (TPR) repeat protein
MNEITNRMRTHDLHAPQADEDALLESVLSGSDRLLAESLREDERRRRVRRLIYFTLSIGGVVMGTIVVAVLAGWLTLFAQPSTGQAELGKEAWVERLTGLREHMHTAFGVGPDLTQLEPDLGLEIVREAWPKITVPEVKTGLLKTFAFSKALPEKHSKVLQVLHLGMTDQDPEIRAYAAGYVEEYSGQDFSNDPAAYKAWYRDNAKQPPQELLARREPQAKRSADRPAASDRREAVARADAHATQGWQLWRQQKMAEAAEEFEQAVALDPDSANSWNGLGWARFNSGDTERAIKAFEQCVESDRNHPAGLNGLGQAYLMWGELDKAEKYLLKSARAPDASAAWHGLAKLYLLTGKYDDAQKWIKTSLRGLNKPPRVLGVSEQEKEQQQSMLKEMLAAAKTGQLPDALRKRLEPPGKPANTPAARAAAEGWQQFNAGQLRAAELSFNRALAKDPENLAAMNGLGFLLLNTGKTAEAKQFFERYLEIEPDAAGPMNGLARCLKENGKVDEAIALWEKMYKLYPGPNAAAVGLAQAHLERGEHDKALPYFEQLASAQPDNAEFKRGLEAARAGGKNGH